jgi:hypothetical protein
MSTPKKILRAAGSLWFAAVLLVILLVAMACATVVESTRGTPWALHQFYHARWFAVLLGLLAVNVVAAVLLRVPFTKHQIGFAITHLGIVVTLGGAVVTDRVAVRGQVALAEGESANSFRVEAKDTMSVISLVDGTESTVDLTSRAFRGQEVVDRPSAPVLAAGDLRVEVLRYAPDSRMSRQVSDDNPQANPAVEVLLSGSGPDDPVWLFAGNLTALGTGQAMRQAVYRVAADADELKRLLSPPVESLKLTFVAPGQDSAAPAGLVRLEYQGGKFEVPLDDCRQEAAPVGDTGYTVRVLEFFTHATVEGGKLVNAPGRPENPAIQAELIGPGGGRETLLAFSRFPDFATMHGGRDDAGSQVPIQVLAGPDGTLYARFAVQGRQPVVKRASVGEAMETPWSGLSLTVLRRFERARAAEIVEPTEPRGDARVPALLLEMTRGADSREFWVQKFTPATAALGDARYRITYRDKVLPLGFEMTLNRFHIGTYPGTSRHRSYESHVTLTDPHTGRERDRIVSMNSPAKQAGYSLFQSSYRLGGGQKVSVLSVARDPGLPIVYVGYVAMMAGMVVVLITRVLERRRLADASQMNEKVTS